MEEYRIALLRGDGIGPEIVDAAVRVLEAVGGRCRRRFRFAAYDIGGCAIDRTGAPLPEETVEGCLNSDAVLLGAVGGPKWDGLPGHLRPEKALLGIRKALGVYTNLRPARLYPALADASPLRMEACGGGFDIMIVRELTGGIYFGERGRTSGPDGEAAFDTERYSRSEIERIAHAAFAVAQKRGRRVTSVDKANVLESSRLWRETVHAVAAQYPDVALSDMFVDNAAMQLVRAPGQFDVIVTSNMFGDILSDEASMITGSIGMIPSSSLGDGTRGLYEPIHGSAPDIAGKDIVNPTACILSAAMMLRYSFGMAEEADAIETAVNKVLDKGLRTADNMSEGCTCLGCTAMGDAILAEI